MKDHRLQYWYALHVRSRREHVVARQLDYKAFEVFLPLYNERRRWADRWKDVRLPLFPGYVFCRFDLESQSRALATSGVIDVVRSGGLPAPLEGSQIEDIRRTTLNSDKVEPYPRLARGQTVLLCEGPLKGITGTLIDFRGCLRLVISVELLQRSVMVEVDRSWAMPAQPAQIVAGAWLKNANSHGIAFAGI